MEKKTKVVEDYPPNYYFIKDFFKDIDTFQPFFAYGNVIYNPFKRQLSPDVELHEQVHFRQQGNNPDVWWASYCTDRDFREQMEVEAYAEQYRFLKKFIPKADKEIVDDFADILSSPLYNLNISKHQAKTLIRHKVKEINNAT